MDQAVFKTVYRGRQRWIHHLAYMRLGKVFLMLELIRRGGVHLEGQRVLDFGFGAGTFFRYLPTTAALFGLEQDGTACREVTAMLRSRGFCRIDLRTVEEDPNSAEPLLSQGYHLIVLSHVLEHLPDPARLLGKLCKNLQPGGLILGAVPIHERILNPHHVQKIDAAQLRFWAETAGLQIKDYTEGDPWFYWIQPLFNHHQGWRLQLARGISLGTGCLASLLGPRLWAGIGRWFGLLTGSRPTQAGFIFVPK